MDDGRPIFLQIAARLEDDILAGTMPEESQVPSINEMAAFYRINPATALKGVQRLVDAGVLYKRRGIGMFVATGAQAQLLDERRRAFQEDFLRPVAAQARALGITPARLAELIEKEMEK